MSLCGILHDMGKNKQDFDDYLHADEKIRQKLRGTIPHASTGAKYIYDLHHNDADFNLKDNAFSLFQIIRNSSDASTKILSRS